ncbi:synaptonemal complex protein 2-like [Durio zibethinus]|uniref:Synaptonemal complex protein 2-like n=1 Tax=Durio zibethinus TaxID=66656 RepID=A0A6P6AM85_DURZI|nr:synaptonemal complex protein 2-like [Durio zibethinus]
MKHSVLTKLKNPSGCFIKASLWNLLHADDLIKKFEATVAANKQPAESLNSKMGQVQLELRSKEDEIKCLLTTQENLEKQKSDLLLSNNEFAKKLSISPEEIILKLVQQERDLAAKHAKKKYEQLHDKLERYALQLVNQKLNSKIIDLQKAQESVMAQLSEECHLAGERIRKLESEAESLVLKKIETEKLVSKLGEKIDTLSESSRSYENKMQDLSLKISALEMENKDNAEKMQVEILGKTEEIANLERECEKHAEQVDSLEKQVGHLQFMLKEKEQLILQYKDRGKKLEVQISELLKENLWKRGSNDVMLESKQLELSRHLKEISQRNDQIKKRDSGIGRRTQDAWWGQRMKRRNHHSRCNTNTSVKMLKKVENTNTGSVMSISKHNKKVTHHEYEVETTNGEQLQTKKNEKQLMLTSLVSPYIRIQKHKKVRTPRANTPEFGQGTKGSHPNASNIGDLFSEGSLNPHVDDPYAFD